MTNIPEKISVRGDQAVREKHRRPPAHGGGKTWDTYLGESGAVYERAREDGQIICTIQAEKEER